MVSFHEMTVQPPPAINTRSGLVLDFADPSPASIAIDDIAGGLAVAARFGGQALRFRSVAEHVMDVAAVIGLAGHSELALAALHHDSHEAYACDIPKPLKRVLGGAYEVVTDRLDAAIAKSLDFDLPEPGSPEAISIKEADDIMFIVEAEELLPGKPSLPHVDETLLETARAAANLTSGWDRAEIEKRFLVIHDGLVGRALY